MFEKVYRHNLDAKNRMRIPAKLRETLGERYTITIGTGGCLFVFSEEEWKKLTAELQNVSIFDVEAQKPLRFLIANSWEAEEDKQGRILLPENLRKYAKLNKDLVTIQNFKCIEIWGAESWEDYTYGVDFDEVAGKLLGADKK